MTNKIASRAIAAAVSAAGVLTLILVFLAGGVRADDKGAAANPAAPAAPAAPAPAPAAAKPSPPPGPVEPDAMTKLDFSGLNADQKKLAAALLNENSCDCGCGMKLAVCRRDDPNCTRSTGIGGQVIDLAKQGKSRDEIVKTVLSPPWRYVQFAMSPGKAPAIGPENAKIPMIVYLDYQCPFCQKFLPTIEQVTKDYPKDVRITIKMHPLSIHPNALPAAEAAMAANAQGKFFEMHKKLYENQTNLTRDKFVALAKEIGLDVDKFTKDLDAHTYLPGIQAEAKEVEDIGATGTPVTFINGRFLNGAKPYANLKDTIDEELGWAKAGNRPAFKTGRNISETTYPKPVQPGPDPNKIYDLKAGDAPFKGPANAKVTILHYFDYQCPFCVRVSPTLEQILKAYPNDVRIVYKMHPLPFHDHAMIGAEAAQAAKAQGKFHEMTEKLMATNGQFSRDKIMEIAQSLGLDMKKFTSDLDNHTYKAAIDAEAKEAMDAGANGTPASFINGHFVNGAQPYEQFKAVIDAELAKTTTKASN